MLVHRDVPHALLNAAGLAGVLILWPQLTTSALSVIWLGALYGASTPIVVDSAAYGASGLVHAMFTYAAIRWSFDGSHTHLCRALLLSGIGIKLLVETTGLVDTHEIAWRLHISGSLSGLTLHVAQQFCERLKR